MRFGQLYISRYSYFFRTSNNVFLAYSSKTNSFLELTEDIYEVLRDVQSHGKAEEQISTIPDDVLSVLQSEGFVCTPEDDDDYVLKSQFITQTFQHDKSHLNLVLVPTLNCNFSCPYCFERKKRASRMSAEVIDNLLTFIKETKGLQQLAITWYGGEPLLEIATIEKILTRIKEEVSVDLKSHTIVTNGYLFNDKALDLFEKFPLDAIQITLDGWRDRHDRLRALKSSGLPTFDTILSNIERIADRLNHTKLDLRVNIDKSNIDDFQRISDLIRSRIDSKNISVYPGIIRLENDDKTNLVEPALGRWETAKLMYGLYSTGVLNGSIYPIQRPAKTCCAQCVSSYIVGPEGEIYKCWNDVSDNSKVVGYINQPKIINQSLYYRYHQGCAWYNDPECKACFFLPICNGKCAWYNERNLYHNGQYNLCQCIQKAPGMLDQCLESYYEQLQKQYAYERME